MECDVFPFSLFRGTVDGNFPSFLPILLFLSSDLLGSYSPPGSTSCEGCPPGTADTDSNPATPCFTCNVGTYAPGNTTTCTPCPPGTIDLDFNAATPCQPCPQPPVVPYNSFISQSGSTSCVPVSLCSFNVSFQTVAPTSSSDRVCSPVTSCNARLQFQYISPTLTSDRVCLSFLNPYVNVEFNVATPVSLLHQEQALLNDAVANGRLLSELQSLSPRTFDSSILFPLSAKAVPTFFDNPDVNHSFIIAAIQLLNSSHSILNPASPSSNYVRANSNFIAAIATSMNVSLSSVVLIASNATQGSSLTQWYFRLDVLSTVAQQTAQNLSYILNATFVYSLRNYDSISFGSISALLAILNPFIVDHKG